MRLGLGHIGAGILAHFETVARSAQLLGDDADIAVADLRDLGVTPNIHVGLHRVEQHDLLQIDQAEPRGRDLLTRRLDQNTRAAIVKDQQVRHQLQRADCLGRAGIARGRRVEANDGSETSDLLGDALILQAQKLSVLLKQIGISVGRG